MIPGVLLGTRRARLVLERRWVTCPGPSWRLRVWGRDARVEADHPVAASAGLVEAVVSAESLLAGLGLRVEQWYPDGPHTAYAVLSVVARSRGGDGE